MVQEFRRRGSAEKARELDLAPRRLKEIVAANDERHALCEIIHGGGELIRPLAVAIAGQQVAALLPRLLLERAVAQVDEPFDGRLEPHAQRAPGLIGQSARRAGARIPPLSV